MVEVQREVMLLLYEGVRLPPVRIGDVGYQASLFRGCGMCESACPSHLPIATLFRAVAQETQALFDYEAGRSLEEDLPLATFREDELRELGK